MTEENTLYQHISIAKKEGSEIEITAEIPKTVIVTYRNRALKKLGENLELPGFRKGHIPEKVLVGKLGETAILEEAAEMAMPDVYQKIIKENKLSVIGHPHITITKLAPGNPVTFKLETAVVPEITLPDYKKIAEEVLLKTTSEKIEVTDKEVTDTISQLQEHHKKKSGEASIPEFTDEFVKKLGDFKDVLDFKTKLRANIQNEKERKAKEGRRVQVGDAIIAGTTIPLPKILVESELDKMLGQFKEDIKRMGMEFDTYLTNLKKTEEDLRGEWKVDAEKRAKLQLVLNKIAELEKITADEEKLKREVQHLLTHFKDADPARLRIYVETMLQNEQVFQLLESQKNKEG